MASSKTSPPRAFFGLGPATEKLDKRFFDFHVDLGPDTAAHMLDGDQVWRAERKGQWAALLHFNRVTEAELALPVSKTGRQ